MPLFVLVHSPLTGLLTWAFTANELWDRGYDVVVPGLHSDVDAWHAGTPYWRQHVDQVVQSLDELHSEGPEGVDPNDPVVLVGHSGAGVLLPAIADAITESSNRPIAAYILCDADIPQDGASRLDRFADPADADSFRRAAVDDMLPPFPEAVLEQTIPDDGVRAQFREDLRATPLEVYEEPIPVPTTWPDAPVAYLGFSRSRDSYPNSIKHALAEGWPFSELEGAHFHMLVDPARVARALVDLATKCGVEFEQQLDVEPD